MADELAIPLAAAIEALRVEVVDAVRQGKNDDVRFALGPIELEFQVEAGREVGGDAGIRFWVVSIGGKGSRTSSSTHTVKLTLTPVSSAGGDVLVGSTVERRPK